MQLPQLLPSRGTRRPRRAMLAGGASMVAAGAAVTVFVTSGWAVAAPAPLPRTDPSRSAGANGPSVLSAKSLSARVDQPAGTRARQWRDGGYVVLLDAPPAATYTGGVAGLAATKPKVGSRLTATEPSVARYSTHLAAAQTDVLDSVGARALHRYTLAANGFSARLTGAQAARLARTPGVLSVTPDRSLHPDTVSSPEFLSVAGAGGTWEQLGGQATAGAGIVVGVLDSGVDPTSPSFAGSPVTRTTPGAVGEPYRTPGGQIAVRKLRGGTFTGTCQTGPQFPASACSSTIVGARFFNSGLTPAELALASNPASPVDLEGHGTHTASTAVGRPAKAVIDGRDLGTARGMAPAAKLAVYKVCWDEADGGCPTSDLMKAIDQSVADGVDVINFSIGGAPDPDPVAPIQLAFLAAASAGVFVAASAGNSGPEPATLDHASPWVTTVAATSAVLRRNTVRLGDGRSFRGASLTSTALPATAAIYGRTAVAAGATATDAALCTQNTLDPAAVKGKIVVCDRGVSSRVSKSTEVARAGGIGMVLLDISADNDVLSDRHPVPTVHLRAADRAAVLAYLDAQGARATVEIRLGDTTGGTAEPTPVVAAFSSRGRDAVTDGDVLKPDLAAPGVDVIAALPKGTPESGPNRFGSLSGTSMAAPHIAGLAALIYQAHPTWSPMAVKSAMMTTAKSTFEADGTVSEDATAQGAGFVQPKRFLTPGLVYDAGSADWYSFLEGLGVDTGKGARPIAAADLNQPSIGLSELAGTRTVTRTVTATTPGTYRATVSLPGIAATVSPATLTFAAAGEKKTFTVTLTRQAADLGDLIQGFLTWTSDSITVRSPISVLVVSADAPPVVQVDTSTATGSVSVPVALGQPSVDVRVAGLTAAKVTKGTVAVGDATASTQGNAANRVVPVDIPAGTRVAKIELLTPQQGSQAGLTIYDQNLQVVAAPGVAARTWYTAGGPAAQRWWVTVNGLEAAAGATTVPYELRVFLVPAAAAGNLTPSPQPLTGALGASARLTLRWAGLTAGTPYLGLLTFGADGTAFPTVVQVG